MGSCECHGNGSGCKCGVSIDSKVNSNDSGNNFWKKHKLSLISMASGFIIGVYSFATIPAPNNEATVYRSTIQLLEQAYNYKNSKEQFPVDNFDSNFRKNNLDYVISTLKEDSVELSNNYYFKQYSDDVRRNNNANNLGLLITISGLISFGYNGYKDKKNKNSALDANKARSKTGT